MARLEPLAAAAVPLAAAMRIRQSGGVTGFIASIYRHPIKGFTPEPLRSVRLASGEPFPCDRLFAVEDGPSGFDPEAPVHISKTAFTVLARTARVAMVRTRYDETAGVLHAGAPGQMDFRAPLHDAAGRGAFADWLAGFLGEEVTGPLRVVEGPGLHRFLDHPKGQVSVINLASVRDLGCRLGREIDPLRFRANFYVEGWPPWIETGWTGATLNLGAARASVFKPIVRCAATGVDPATGLRDLDLVKALFDHLGHVWCGVYVQVSDAGEASIGDQADLV